MLELKQRYIELLHFRAARDILGASLALYATDVDDNWLGEVALSGEFGEPLWFDTTGLTKDELLEPCLRLLFTSQDSVTTMVNWKRITRLLIHRGLGEWGLKRLNLIGWEIRDKIDLGSIKQGVILFFEDRQEGYGGHSFNLKRDNFERFFEFLKIDSETSHRLLKDVSNSKDYTQIIDFLKKLDFEKQQLFHQPE